MTPSHAPERLDRFMARANAAYYARQDPFRDFTTAPEISQMFGELLGAWCAAVWEGMGRPSPVLLAEAGPGRGTLMADALRATRGMVGFAAAARVHFIETSPRLRAAQAARVPQASWHDGLGDLPPGPLILLANEFLDALPIRQFVRRQGAWLERFVVGGAFVECPAPPLAEAAPEGAVVERGEAALAWCAALAARIRAEGGAALLIDYGGAGGGDTLQALRAGRPAAPLASPGEADLTAHVDFAALSAAVRAAGAACWGPVPQGAFLAALGLAARAAALTAANPFRAAEIAEAADRLAHPARMGTLFKAMAVTPPGAAAPPGFPPAA